MIEQENTKPVEDHCHDNPGYHGNIELRDMSPASSRCTRSTIPDDRILEFKEDSSSFSDDIPSCSGASGFSNNSEDNELNELLRLEDSREKSSSKDDVTMITNVRKVKLRPDFRGIGITIAGGVYTPYGPELLPVFITGVDPNGPASQTKLVKPGDRIVAVNGANMIGRTHREVVEAVKAAGDDLTLELTEGPEDIMRFVTFD